MRPPFAKEADGRAAALLHRREEQESMATEELPRERMREVRRLRLAYRERVGRVDGA
jgi:hypothetical protein